MKMLSFAVIVGASATLAAMPQNPTPAAQMPKPAPVAVQGCIDRAMSSANATALTLTDYHCATVLERQYAVILGGDLFALLYCSNELIAYCSRSKLLYRRRGNIH